MMSKIKLSYLLLLHIPYIAHADEMLSKSEQAEMIRAHNHWRQKVNVPELTWSNYLAATAQQYAERLSQTGCKMAHSSNRFGENIYWASPLTLTYSTGKVVTEAQTISPSHVTKLWGSEAKDYRHQTNTCRKGAKCGHYTQVVWKSTSEVGCGKAMCADKAQIWVCNYNPPGNIVGQQPY